MYRRYIKSFFDYFLAILFLPFVMLLMVPLIIALWFSVNSFPIFSQKRVGLNNKIFVIYKLKTMVDSKDLLLSDLQRTTGLGKVIRKFSLDELPQFYNILKGDLSFVGPRPLLVQYLDFYTEEQKKRHLVKSGITGWAQVNGRNTISWQEKFALDVFYCHNQTFFLDIKILILTIFAVLIPKGINKNQEITMEYFTGNE